jgi:hypothetical protein
VREVIFLVRSRPGMPAIWVGCGLIVAGLGYAFFIRPLVAKGGAA